MGEKSKVMPGKGYASITGRQHIGYAGKRITPPKQWTTSDQQQAWLDGFAAGVKANDAEWEKSTAETGWTATKANDADAKATGK